MMATLEPTNLSAQSAASERMRMKVRLNFSVKPRKPLF